MKKMIMFLAASVVAMGFAVKSSAQISVGFGYASEQIIKKDIDVPDGYTGTSWDKSFRNMNGFYVEAAYNWEFMTFGTGALSLQPGLRYSLYTTRNSKHFTNIKSDADKKKSRTISRESDHVLDIPINVRYSYDLVPGLVKAYAYAGPVLSLGLAYNSVSNVKRSDDSSEYSYKSKYNAYTGKFSEKENNNGTKDSGSSESDNELNMFDLKLGLGLGATISEKVDVKFGYNIGLLNRAANSTNKKFHFNVLYFGVAYNF